MNGVQYITDANGHRTGVILSLEEYEEYVTDMGMADAAREMKDEPIRDLEDVLTEMKAEGELDV